MGGFEHGMKNPFDLQIFILLLDGCGTGEQPDSPAFGDAGANTLRHVLEVTGVRLPNLEKFGLLRFAGSGMRGTASGGRLEQKSKGKDTASGHWELMGVPVDVEFPVYPHGFPPEIIGPFCRAVGRGILGNTPASGTEILERLGPEHLRTGDLIVYTSGDSVFQVAACETVVPVEELYRCCAIARDLLKGPHAVCRVIARPFIVQDGRFVRTPRRKDFALPPPAPTFLERLQDAGGTVLGIGKIEDIFAHRGITENRKTINNRDGLERLHAALREDFTLTFCNLVQFDSDWGHRRDAAGFARGLQEVDAFLPRLLETLGERQILMVTADHGCDPCHAGTDHTREYVPCLFHGKAIRGGVECPDTPQSALAWTLARLLGLSFYHESGWAPLLSMGITK